MPGLAEQFGIGWVPGVAPWDAAPDGGDPDPFLTAARQWPPLESGPADFAMPWSAEPLGGQPAPDLAGIAQEAAATAPAHVPGDAVPDAADIEIDPTGGAEPIDPYPVQIGRPRDWMPRETDPPSPVLDAYEDPAEAAPTGAGMFGRFVEPFATSNDLDAMDDTETFVDTDAPDETEAEANESYAQMLANDPERLMRARLDRDEMMAAEQRRIVLKQAKEEGDALELDLAAHKAAREKAQADRAEIEQEARALTESSPFARYWSDASVAGKIGGAILAIFGGLMMPKTGGRNSGIDYMMQLADADTANKWKGIQARREATGEAMADADADFKMQQALRVAGREQVYRTMEAELAGMDPAGTMAIDLATEIVNGRAQLQQSLAADMATQEKRYLERYKVDQEDRKIELDANKAQDASDLAWAKFKRQGQGTGGGGGLFGKNTRFTPEQWAALVPGVDVSKLPAGIPLSHDEVDKILGLQGKVNQQGVDAARGTGITQENAERDAKATIIDPRRPGVVVGVVKDPKLAETIKQSLPATIEATETLDEMLRIMDVEGGASDLVKNANWQKLTGDEAYLGNVVRVAKRMGAYDAGVAKLVEDLRGGVNTKSFVRDAAPGLRNLRAKLVRSSELELGAAGLEPYKFPDNSKLPAAKVDKDAARLTRPAGIVDTGKAALRRAQGSILPEDYDGLTDDNRAALVTQRADMERDGDPDRALKAAATIADNAAKATNPAARTASAYALWRARKAGNAAARAAFDALDPGTRAAALSALPREEAIQAFAEIFPGSD